MNRAPTPLRKVLCYALLSLVGLTMIFPFLWMLSTSLKPEEEVFQGSEQFVRALLPQHVRWQNYTDVFAKIPFARYAINSIIVALFVTFGQTFTSALAAYAFSRVRWSGRDKIFLIYLATMMVPGAVTMIPNFILLRFMPEIAASLLGPWWNTYLVAPHPWSGVQLGRAIGTDSYFAMIVPAMFSAYGTFMLRQFFMGISPELEEAARIDGCGHWKIFTKVILPLSQTALVTLGIFTFMGNWRSFMWPLIVINQDYLKNLPLGIQSFVGLYGNDWSLLMAASMMLILPIIVVYLVGQKFFVSGIQLGGVKG